MLFAESIVKHMGPILNLRICRIHDVTIYRCRYFAIFHSSPWACFSVQPNSRRSFPTCTTALFLYETSFADISSTLHVISSSCRIPKARSSADYNFKNATHSSIFLTGSLLNSFSHTINILYPRSLTAFNRLASLSHTSLASILSVGYDMKSVDL